MIDGRRRKTRRRRRWGNKRRTSPKCGRRRRSTLKKFRTHPTFVCQKTLCGTNRPAAWESGDIRKEEFGIEEEEEEEEEEEKAFEQNFGVGKPPPSEEGEGRKREEKNIDWQFGFLLPRDKGRELGDGGGQDCSETPMERKDKICETSQQSFFKLGFSSFLERNFYNSIFLFRAVFSPFRFRLEIHLSFSFLPSSPHSLFLYAIPPFVQCHHTPAAFSVCMYARRRRQFSRVRVFDKAVLCQRF